MEAKELAMYSVYKVDKILNGTVEHSCCLCQDKITERKMKVLAKKGEVNKQFFFCTKCFASGMANLNNSGRITR